LPDKPDQEDRESRSKKVEKMEKVRMKKDNRDWYRDAELDESLNEQLKDNLKEIIIGDESVTLSARLWGWNIGTSLTAFIFGLVILPLAIVPMFVGAIRNWKWIGSCVAAILGLIALILGMVFYFGSPGENIDGLSQGVGLSPGPYLVLLGSLFVLIGGAFDGVFGTMALFGGGKKSAHAADMDDLDALEMDDE
jgi:hypothetical protein